MKRLKGRLPKLIDEALGQQTRFDESWANNLRLFFAGAFFSAGLRNWDQYPAAKPIYMALGVGWLLVFVVAKIRAKDQTESKNTLTTLLDITVINIGILLFTRRGLFPGFSTGLYLVYYPVLALAASRLRPALVVLAAFWAMVFYAPLSIYAGTPSWTRVAMFTVTAVVLMMASRSPKNLMVKVAGDALQEAYEEGAKAKEVDLTAQIHQLYLPPPIVDLPEIWSSSKHGAGTETGGDYFHIFETARGPLAVLGDFGGQGFQALNDVKQLHQQLAKLVSQEPSLPKILAELNTYVYELFKGRHPFTCIMVEWQGDEMRYANAGHLPAIRLNKQERIRLLVSSTAVGLDPTTTFIEEIVPFPARDLLIMYTDGAFAKLTDDRNKGVEEIESFVDKFSGGEVNTLCHRIFDCAQPGLEPNRDDSTVVVIRRQPTSASAAAEGKA